MVVKQQRISEIKKRIIINKMNEGQEEDVPLYTWKTIPESLKQFWIKQIEEWKKKIF